jgi:hypothetical protein
MTIPMPVNLSSGAIRRRVYLKKSSIYITIFFGGSVVKNKWHILSHLFLIYIIAGFERAPRL